VPAICVKTGVTLLDPLPQAVPARALHADPAVRLTSVADSSAHIAAVLELARRDSDLFLHGLAVGKLAEGIALALGLPRPYAGRIRLAGVLHDIGKLAVPQALLSKTGALSHGERRVIERHSVIGAAVVQLAGLHREARWIRHHHERMDGLGYPDRLSANDIPLPSRIILVADAFDVLTFGRPYRSASTTEEALAELGAHSGTQFDPECVATLQQLVASNVAGPRV
jgi:putative nucleotidyltransferase with HDIG domain